MTINAVHQVRGLSIEPSLAIFLAAVRNFLRLFYVVCSLDGSVKIQAKSIIYRFNMTIIIYRAGLFDDCYLGGASFAGRRIPILLRVSLVMKYRYHLMKIKARFIE